MSQIKIFITVYMKLIEEYFIVYFSSVRRVCVCRNDIQIGKTIDMTTYVMCTSRVGD